MINENAAEFAGKPVQDWTAESGIAEPEKYNYRISVDYDDKQLWTDKLAAFLDDPNAAKVTGLIVGNWGDVATGDDPVTKVVEPLTVARERLPNLTALFLGDITSEESEISWIVQGDLSPLLRAYPNLEHLRVRGATNLRFGALRHDHLKALIVESGGLPVVVIREVLNARLPALEHLELWLGTGEYGWDGSINDMQAFFDGVLFPNLRYLGLRNSEITDMIATAIASAPIMQSLETLDLALGTLSDDGATALLNSPYVPRLAKLDIHHHYLSDEMVARMTTIRSERKSAASSVASESSASSSEFLIVDVSEGEDGTDRIDVEDRYVAVGE